MTESLRSGADGTITTVPPYALDVSPDSVLTFTLIRNDDVPKCIMSLRHPGGDDAIAFKVKTTQPRRYLVRPNQGMVLPGQVSSVSILLVEKDKQTLLQSYDRLGPSALEHSKDKFLVQSCIVSNEFAKSEGKALTESLTGMWNQVGSKSDTVYNKKLHVKHIVSPVGAAGVASPTPTQKNLAVSSSADPKLENMSTDQMREEIVNLRRKYDELVAFSVNLTAERDVLNNTLEQTKRDLNREIQGRNTTAGDGVVKSKTKAASGLQFSLVQVFIVALSCVIAGGLLGESGVKTFLSQVPVLGGFLTEGEMETDGVAE